MPNISQSLAPVYNFVISDKAGKPTLITLSSLDCFTFSLSTGQAGQQTTRFQQALPSPLSR
ncbi:hypothetical protein PAAG_07345 [Paracoccidioides lutzii Pb01]|uniref:Uncharacterized protein n=1 Tax=Paracoccidioides lutzii (strain ATCC MYA-826 / Pb01) TaxID=502779 RepID=C1H9A4_PARBA|nr:hypothetical protein PAAG_07345 [Paracoccidioides lutzii Pb01]EEH36927.2 hypothetical protein PAAG_07345 [Paracoccidioides lutzii Pb01]